MNRRRFVLIILFLAFASLFLSACAADSDLTAPGVTLSVGESDSSKEVVSGVQLLVLLTVLSVAPSLIMMATSFTRIIIVFSMLRNAFGAPTIPPNQVIVGLSLLLTFFIMAPVYAKVDETAIQPYLKEEITQQEAFERSMDPIREFMFNQTREKDIELFMEISGEAQPTTLDDIPTIVLLPAFVISELRTAFTMGFVIYIPFLVIDLVISSVLLSMGMMMLPPTVISLPFKLLLFVLVDGWYLITRSLALSFFS